MFPPFVSVRTVVRVSAALIALAPPDVAGAPLTLEAAVDRALTLAPSMALARAEVKGRSADERTQAGRFDWSVDATASHDYVDATLSRTQDLGDNLSVLGLGVDREFGIGLTVRPYVDLSRRSTDVSGSQGFLATQNAARAGIELTQPILRGAGPANTAALAAAGRRHEASISDLEWVAAQLVREVALAYWTYRGATERVEVLQAAEALGQQLLEKTERLVAAQQRPAGELELLVAARAERARAHIEAELSQREARFALGLAMGLEADAVEALESPSQPLPSPRDELPGAARLQDLALQRRADLRAARDRLDAARLELDAADNQSLPRLDARASANYTMVDDNQGQSLLAPLGASTPGFAVGVGLQLSLPVENRVRDGRRQAQHANQDRARTLLLDLERRARAAVRLAIVRLSRRAEALSRADEARAAYARAAENEATKVQSGLSTLLDLIVFQDRAINARLISIDAQVRYAAAFVELQFSSGALGSRGIAQLARAEVSQ